MLPNNLSVHVIAKGGAGSLVKSPKAIADVNCCMGFLRFVLSKKNHRNPRGAVSAYLTSNVAITAL